MKISSLKFTFLTALFITAMNFTFFTILVLFFSLILFKFNSKFLLVLFITISGISSYFIHIYGVVIDSEMIRNSLQTDIKEVNFY